MPKFTPYVTHVVDPVGVDTSIEPRPMEMGSDQSRESVVAKTSGKPLVDFEGRTNPYIDYQSIDILLSLQHPRSGGYDEMCFIVMGQIKEMIFRGVCATRQLAKRQLTWLRSWPEIRWLTMENKDNLQQVLNAVSKL